MKYNFILFLLSISLTSLAQESLNVELFGLVNRGDERYSGSWSYIGADGSEYALIGAKSGLAVYSIDDPLAIEELGFVSGPSSNWREITVLGDYAYVTTEGPSDSTGLQVINLSELPERISLVTTYSETFTKGHILQRDIYSDAPYIYINGTSTTQGIHILDVSDPSNPVEVGLYNPGYYIHDCHVKGNRIYAAAFFEGTIDVLDISDKTTPTLLTRINGIESNVHSSWLTEDNRYLIVSEELDGLPAHVVNIENLDDFYVAATYTANELSLTHNPYVRGDFVFFSHNTEGLRVLDIADPAVPVEVGYYDTYEGESGGFKGLWSACPYFPSGKIIGGDRTKGLFVWTFNDTYAGRIYGEISDFATDEKLLNATASLLELTDTIPLDLDARFAYGTMEGTYTLKITAEGYYDELISIDLKQKDSLWFDIKLLPLNTSDFSGSKVNIFPNPFINETIVDTRLLPSAEQIIIYDVKGRLLKRIPIGDIKKAKLDFQNLVAGVYLLTVLDNNGKVLAESKLLHQ